MILTSLYGLIKIYACLDHFENIVNTQFEIDNGGLVALYMDVDVHVSDNLLKCLIIILILNGYL